MMTLSGTPVSSWFQTQDFGDVSKSSRLTEAYIEYASRPTAASCASLTSFALGGVEVVGATVPAFDEIGTDNMPGRFTLRSHGRYHRLQFNLTGACRVTGYTAKIEPKGSR
jgi:hypothetical protein